MSLLEKGGEQFTAAFEEIKAIEKTAKKEISEWLDIMAMTRLLPTNIDECKLTNANVSDGIVNAINSVISS